MFRVILDWGQGLRWKDPFYNISLLEEVWFQIDFVKVFFRCLYNCLVVFETGSFNGFSWLDQGRELLTNPL